MQSKNIQIFIEICSNCKQHSWCTRHREQVYLLLAKDIQTQVLHAHPEVQVLVVPVGGTKMGSFQISSQGVVLFSKLTCGYFPHTGAVTSRISNFIEDVKNGKDLTSYQNLQQSPVKCNSNYNRSPSPNQSPMRKTNPLAFKISESSKKQEEVPQKKAKESQAKQQKKETTHKAKIQTHEKQKVQQPVVEQPIKEVKQQSKPHIGSIKNIQRVQETRTVQRGQVILPQKKQIPHKIAKQQEKIQHHQKESVKVHSQNKIEQQNKGQKQKATQKNQITHQNKQEQVFVNKEQTPVQKQINKQEKHKESESKIQQAQKQIVEEKHIQSSQKKVQSQQNTKVQQKNESKVQQQNYDQVFQGQQYLTKNAQKISEKNIIQQQKKQKPQKNSKAQQEQPSPQKVKQNKVSEEKGKQKVQTKENIQQKDEFLQDCREAFSHYDKDKSGFFDIAEMNNFFDDLLGNMRLTSEQSQVFKAKFLAESDLNRDQKIQFNELVSIAKKIIHS